MIASIPSPTEGVWYLGPVPIRAYALAIMIGIVVAIWLGERRWIARGGRPGDVLDIAIWAVPFGIVGARLYHLITDWDNYFAAGREPLEALRIWEGGLSIWGAIAGGALGGWIAARRRGIPFPALADALAPGIVLAQAIGRWGNYFNNELYGRPTDLPWGLDVHQMQDFRAVRDDTGAPMLVDGGPFHPIFLYESLWAVGTALVLIWADRRFRMGHGRVFALYVALYTAGRTWIENLRIDDGGEVAGPAREFLGMRVNAWVSVLLMVGAIAYIVISARLKPGRETIDLPPLEGAQAEPVSADAKANAEGETEAEAEAAADAESESGDEAKVGVGVATDADASTGAGAEAESGDEANVGVGAGADASTGAGAEAESGGEAKVGAGAAADANADAKTESADKTRSEADADKDAETKVDVDGDTEAEADIAAAQPSAGAEAATKVEVQAASEADEADAERDAEAGDAAGEEQSSDREDDVTHTQPAQPEDESALDDAAEAREPQR